MVEYPAMIYKTNRNRTYIANCFVKNIVGFGKTEQDAIKNLEGSLQEIEHNKVCVKPVYGMLFA